MKATTSGVKAKIARAHEHLQSLDREIKGLVESYPYEVAHEYKRESFEHVWTLKNSPPDIPRRINIMVGDVVYNFRSALDHLAWQLVIANGETPTNRTMFPIYWGSRRADYEEAKKSRLKGVSDKAMAIIDRLQPCNGGHSYLGTLDTLSNIDKHRHLTVIVAAVQGLDLAKPLRIGPKKTVTIWVNKQPLKRDAVLFRVTLQEHEMDVEFEPSFGIAFDDTLTPLEYVGLLIDVRIVLQTIGRAVDEVFRALVKHAR